jgi:hypothetical protein
MNKYMPVEMYINKKFKPYSCDTNCIKYPNNFYIIDLYVWTQSILYVEVVKYVFSNCYSRIHMIIYFESTTPGQNAFPPTTRY